MKTQNFKALRAQRGIALVIVLSVLLLMSALLVAFMGRVSTERASQRAASSTFEARQAYESAVNLVISQIREATKDDTGTVGWATQPGVVRTFDNNGRDLKVFKLYSHESLQVAASSYRPDTPAESGFNPGAPDQPIDATYVNINEPAFTPVPGSVDRVRPHYPIVDPYARKDYSASAVGKEPVLPGRGSVQGFYCTNILHRAQARDEFGNRVLDLPMRVKWLYHLKDGTVAAANAQGIIPGAEKENPPVARVAFWTDDESAKLNVNTAAENTFWDTPGVSTRQESGQITSDAQTERDLNSLSLSASQPARDEYQRYPGHPATTNLSPALRWLFPPTNSAYTEKDFKETLFRLLPRINGGIGTSFSGTQNSWRLYFNPTSGQRTKAANTDPRLAERDRLFASIDEFWFRPDRTPISDAGLYKVFHNPTSETSPGAPWADVAIPQLEQRFGLTPASVLERMRFFLTAVSRSSDLNLYGKPRIPVWAVADQISAPVPAGTLDRRSVFDDLISFCATIGQKNYYFTRLKSQDPYWDLEQAGRRKPKDPSPNGRNKKLFEYLQDMTGKVMPGTDRSFLAKYVADRDQILTEIFDYIRSTNLVDTGNKQVSIVFPPIAQPEYPFAYTPGYDQLKEGDTNKYGGSAKSNLGSGQVVPIIRRENGVNINRGFGRFLTVSECGLAFFIDEGPDINFPTFDTQARVSATDIPIRAVLLTEMFSPSPGYPAHSEAYAYTVKETEDFQFIPLDPNSPPVPMKFARGDANFVEVDAWRGQHGRFFMPTKGFANQFIWDKALNNTRQNKIFANITLPPGPRIYSNSLSDNDYERYPFFSQRFWVRNINPATAPTQFKFRGGKLRYNIHNLVIPDAALPPAIPPFHPVASSQPIQVVNVNFGSGETYTVKVPVKTGTGSHNWTRIINDAFKVAPGNAEFGAMSVRSVELNGAARGDFRLGVANYEVPETYFTPPGLPSNLGGRYKTDDQRVHNFRTGWGQRYSGAAPQGNIAPGQQHRGDKIIDLPQSIPYGGPAVNGVPAPGGGPYGDFDRGISKHTDGPFINKADEGNIRFDADDSLGTGGALPYYRGSGGYDEVGSNFFSPNRIIPSAVMLGSLPTGVKAGVPVGSPLASTSPRAWETLLFAPPLSTSHRGAQSPADHYLLDFFSMPVVEPYAISEPLATAGRINLNTRLAPFGYMKDATNRSYIERSTGLHGVLKGLYQLAVPSSANESAHNEHPISGNNSGSKFRYPVDTFATIERSVNPRFDATPGYFRSATQICELDLLLDHTPPTGITAAAGGGLTSPANRNSFWAANGMTGDNNRERLYSHIYPRVTTKSNTFTVHAWAQSIAKNPSTPDADWNKFDENTDRILGEYRGSSTIERFLDPNDEALLNSDYDATLPTSTGLDPYYRFRVVNHKRFIVQ